MNIEDENTRKRLGNPGTGTATAWMSIGKKNNTVGEQSRPKSAIEQCTTLNNNIPIPLSIPKIVKTPPSVVKNKVSNTCISNYTVPTTTLSEAATITIPIRTSTAQSLESVPPLYKTMPPTVRPLKHTIEDRKNAPVPITEENTFQQRRNKYYKTHRSTSCSSSEASDDDSESRKKRPSKHLTTPTHKPLPQRRDSHDDSSDSQEPSATGTGSGMSSSRVVQPSTGGSNDSGGNQSSDTGNNGNSSLSRRHRGGRRACETRLRESQSLNRITEVQEADATPAQPQRNKGFFHPTRFLNSFAKRPLQVSSDVQNADKMMQVNAARTHVRAAVSEEKENCHKIVSVAEKHGFKKVRLFSRYFQVHKKLCLPRLPLPGLWGRSGRLYKAQSCGSIVRDKITSAGASSLLLVNELCRDKPIVLDPHMARIKLLADMPPCSAELKSPQQSYNVCQVHSGDPSKCCGMC